MDDFSSFDDFEADDSDFEFSGDEFPDSSIENDEYITKQFIEAGDRWLAAVKSNNSIKLDKERVKKWLRSMLKHLEVNEDEVDLQENNKEDSLPPAVKSYITLQNEPEVRSICESDESEVKRLPRVLEDLSKGNIDADNVVAIIRNIVDVLKPAFSNAIAARFDTDTFTSDCVTVVAAGDGAYRPVYESMWNWIKDTEPSGVETYQKVIDASMEGIKYNRKKFGCRNPASLGELYVTAVKVKTSFDKCIANIIQRHNNDKNDTVKFIPTIGLKGITRAVEKCIMRPGGDGSSDSLLDVLRAMLVVKSMQSTTQLCKLFFEELEAPNLKVTRLKDRYLTNPSAGGWRDVMLNVAVLGSDTPPTVPIITAEIQIVHQKMLTNRKTLPGHEIYNPVRIARGLVVKRSGNEDLAKRVIDLGVSATKVDNFIHWTSVKIDLGFEVTEKLWRFTASKLASASEHRGIRDNAFLFALVAANNNWRPDWSFEQLELMEQHWDGVIRNSDGRISELRLETSSIIKIPQLLEVLSSLTSLVVSGCKNLKQIPNTIGSLVSLTRLDLSNCTSLVDLPESIGQLSNLQMLDMTGCSSLRVLPESVGCIRSLILLHLVGCTCLERLPESISSSPTVLAFTGSSAAAPKSVKAQSLDLSGFTYLNEVAVENVLHGMTSLTSLVVGLGNCKFSFEFKDRSVSVSGSNDELSTKFVPIIMKCGAVEVRCQKNKLGDEAGKEIGKALATNSTLTRLNLQWNKLGDEAGKEIGKALATNSTLESLALTNNQLGDEAGKEIGKGLATNSTLTLLTLSNNQLGDEAGKEIGKALATNSTLKELDLSGNKLGDAAGKEIGKGLATNSTLKELILSSNQLGDEAGKEIGKALATNSTLKELRLFGNELGDEAGKEIGKGLATNSTLRLLTLQYNNLSQSTKESIKSTARSGLSVYCSGF